MKKQLLAGLGMAAVLMTAGYAKEFSDVPKDYWANDIITKMSDKGIINGYEDGTFKPEALLNRAEFATIMTKVLNLDTRMYLGSSYADVKTEDWEHNFAEAVKDYLVTYERDGKLYFDSYEPAVREDVIVALVKAMNWDIETLNNKAEDIFSDSDKIGEGLEKYIVSAYENGLVKGYEDKTVNPKGSLTRAEAVALMNVLLSGDVEKDNEENTSYLYKINGIEYRKDDFINYYNIQKAALEQYMGGVEGAEEYIKSMSQSAFVEFKLIRQKAEEMGIELTEEDLSEIEIEMNNEQLDLALQAYNLTEEGYRSVLEDTYISNRLQKTLEEKEIAEIDWDKQFESNPESLYKYNIRHILFSTVDDETGFSKSEEEIKEIEKTANEVLNRLKEGEDFAKLAEEYTEDPGSKTTGGLYENVKVGEMVQEFNDTMIALEDGELHDELVKTSYGYHIMKLDTKSELTEEELYAIKLEIAGARVQEDVSTWFEDIKVEINEEIYNSIK